MRILRKIKDRYTVIAGKREDRYKAMFQNLEKKGVVQDLMPADHPIADTVVDWAVKAMKREDRIMWCLRQFKAALLETKSRKKTESRTLGWRRDLAHFISNAETNRYHDVLEYRFPPDIKPDELIATLRALEAKAVEKKKEDARLVEPEDGVEIAVKFKDGWQWQMLPRGSCQKEGASMRHCGNVPSEQPGDRVLSLREPFERDGKQLWKPHATFILHEDGRLGEMKGFANEKPAAKLHPYIKELLLHDVIEGIKGGGYEAKKNFSLSDLPEAERKELFEKKPILDRVGFYSKNREAVLKENGALGVRPDGSIILRKYKSLADFADDMSKDLARDLEKQDDFDLITVEFSAISNNERMEILEALAKKNPADFLKLAKKLEPDMPEFFDEDEEEDDEERYTFAKAVERKDLHFITKAIEQALDEDELDELRDELSRAVASGWEAGAQNVLAKSIADAVKSPRFNDHDDALGLAWDGEGFWDGEFYLTVSEQQFIEDYSNNAFEDNTAEDYYLNDNSLRYSTPDRLDDFDEEAAYESFVSASSYF